MKRAIRVTSVSYLYRLLHTIKSLFKKKNRAADRLHTFQSRLALLVQTLCLSMIVKAAYKVIFLIRFKIEHH